MIIGVVNARLEATIRMRVLGPSGQEVEVTAALDTAYNGELSLPIAVVTALSLASLPSWHVTLGDGSRKLLSFCQAEVIWDGQRRSVRVLCVQGTPLVGTALLKGYKMEADFVDGGQVILSPLP